MRNLIIIILFSAFVSGPFALCIAQHIDLVTLPTWLTADDAKMLSGGYVEADVKKNATLEGFLSKSFQESMEAEIGNNIPLKADALLLNASIQRSCIAGSNIFFRWGWIPTYFGSSRIFSPDTGLTVTPIGKINEGHDRAMRENATLYAELADRYPEVRFVFAMPDSAETSLFGNRLLSNSVTRDHIKKCFFDFLGDDIAVVPLGIDDITSYISLYHVTDHHWTIDGAYEAYRKIAIQLGFGSHLVKKTNPVEFQVDFYGSQARTGLNDWPSPDTIKDYHFNLPEYEVLISGEPAKEGSEAVASIVAFSNGDFPHDRFVNQYVEYFHDDIPLIELVSAEKRERGSVIIAGDSFTNNMERLFLAHYDHVYACNLKSNKDDLAKLMENVDDLKAVVIIQSYKNVIN